MLVFHVTINLPKQIQYIYIYVNISYIHFRWETQVSSDINHTMWYKLINIYVRKISRLDLQLWSGQEVAFPTLLAMSGHLYLPKSTVYSKSQQHVCVGSLGTMFGEYYLHSQIQSNIALILVVHSTCDRTWWLQESCHYNTAGGLGICCFPSLRGNNNRSGCPWHLRKTTIWNHKNGDFPSLESWISCFISISSGEALNMFTFGAVVWWNLEELGSRTSTQLTALKPSSFCIFSPQEACLYAWNNARG